MTLRTRHEAEIEARRPLTRREVIELAVRQSGICGCGCGVKLNALTEGVVDEHIIALELTGPNDLSNRSLWRKPCSIAKTKGDVAKIAKCRRIVKRETEGPKPSRMRSGRKLESRGFDKTLRKRMDGSVERRS